MGFAGGSGIGNGGTTATELEVLWGSAGTSETRDATEGTVVSGEKKKPTCEVVEVRPGKGLDDMATRTASVLATLLEDGSAGTANVAPMKRVECSILLTAILAGAW